MNPTLQTRRETKERPLKMMKFDSFFGQSPSGMVRVKSFSVESPSQRSFVTILFIVSLMGWVVQVRTRPGQPEGQKASVPGEKNPIWCRW